MQVNVNAKAQNKQNFGMAIHSNPNVNRVLKSRIKKVEDLERLNRIIGEQAKNEKIDITLLVMPDGKSLNAYVYSVKKYNTDKYEFFKNYTENIFTKLFKGPVGFIEKLAKIADKQAGRINQIEAERYEDIFNKMK